MIWFETAVCNCSRPQQPSAFSQTQRLCLVSFKGVVPGWDPVNDRQFSRWRLLNPHFLRSLLLSSLCLGCLEDVTWPILEKFLPLLFSKPCIVFYYRCLKIFFSSLVIALSFFVFFSLPLSCRQRALSLSNKMSPHKMNKRGSGYIRLPIEHSVLNRATEKNYSPHTLCAALCHAPSALISCFHSWERQSTFKSLSSSCCDFSDHWVEQSQVWFLKRCW